jgi:ATP-dependent Lon protease
VAESPPSELPIFELPLAIVPGERVPLHIFEPRYRAMIGACLDEESTFGILFADDDGPRTIGCSASIDDVTERYDDGRLDIVARGEEPFRVIDRFDAPEWPAARIEPVLAGGDAAGEELIAARAAFAELLAAVGAERERAASASDAFTIAAQVEMPGAEKQGLLEASGEVERLVALERSLRRLLAGVKRSRRVAEQAKTNGHGLGVVEPPG